MNLKEFIESNNIAYYDTFENDKTIVDSPKVYINNVLSYGDKDFSNLRLSQHRLTHTASIYAFGIMLYKNLENLKDKLDLFIDNTIGDMYNEFLYNWFLTCFIHDMGYTVVNSDNLEMDIWNTRDKSDIIKEVLNVVEEFQDKSTNIIPSEIKKSFAKYHKYKMILKSEFSGTEFVDHGFFAGAYFIDDRKSKFKRKLDYGDLTYIGDGEYIDKKTNLRWSLEILNGIQHNIAEIVIGHNVFYQKPGNIFADIYNKLGLEDLITSIPKFTYTEYPLYFLMQLVDTLDLYKFFCKDAKDSYTIKNVYKKIIEDVYFTFFRDSFNIDFVNFDKEEVNKYWKYLLKQKYWLPIKVFKKYQVITIKLI